MWVLASELPSSPGHPFYSRLNAILDGEQFDAYVESRCRRFYAEGVGRPGLAPGRYFRLLLLGYFEGLDSERGILVDSAVRSRDGVTVQLLTFTPGPGCAITADVRNPVDVARLPRSGADVVFAERVIQACP